MRIFTVIFLLSLTYDLRTFSEPVQLSEFRERSPGSRRQNKLSDAVATGRDARDVGSAASFAANVFPVQVDLNEWTRKFEEKFGDLTKLVDLRFKALNSLVNGLGEKLDSMDRRQNATEKQTSKQFEEVKERMKQFEGRLNDSKTETEDKMKELETRIKDHSPRPTVYPDSSSSSRPSSRLVLSTVTTPSDGWILILRHNYLDKNAFKHKLWEDYKHEFGDRVNEYWLGLQKMHNITKNGRWNLKIEVKYDLDEDDKPSSRQGQTGVGVWKSFSVASEEEKFELSVGAQLERENMGDYDPLYENNGEKFSTEDNDNDRGYRYYGEYGQYGQYYASSSSCAAVVGGGWWHGMAWHGMPWHNTCYLFCGTCQRDRSDHRDRRDSSLWWDGKNEKLSESSMWIKQEIDN